MKLNGKQNNNNNNKKQEEEEVIINERISIDRKQKQRNELKIK